MGRTPHQEIQRVRINRIKEWLVETNLTVHEIAERAGFEHAEYMAAVFKRETGQAPTTYREMKKRS
jgi:LacI family transcriptional regulator